MEGNVPRLVPVEKISPGFFYGFRFDYEDPVLEGSLERRGILCPLLVAERKGGAASVISGHKRFACALKRKWKEVRASFLQEAFSEKELFLLSVYSNWNQSFSDLDRMEAVRKAEAAFHFSADEIREEILPALGVSPSRQALEEYRGVARLPSEIHRLIQAKKLPFRGAASLRNFSEGEQIFLAKNIFAGLHLTTNQLTLMAEWLSELLKIKKVSLETLVKEGTLEAFLKNPQMDPRTKGERLFLLLRSLRFPKLSKEEADFRRLKSRLEVDGEIQLERAQGFEAEGVLLRARLKNREDLGRVFRFLETHRASLESFL